jgi:hypothetical protein
MDRFHTFSLMRNTYETDFATLIYNFLFLNVWLSILKIIGDTLTEYSSDIFTYLQKKIQYKHRSVKIIGWEIVKTNGWQHDYPVPIQSISYYLHTQRNMTELVYYPTHQESGCSYILGTIYNYQMEPGIFLTVTKKKISQMTKEQQSSQIHQILFEISSKTKSTSEIKDVIQRYCDWYEQTRMERLRDKLYHFVFEKFTDGEPVFRIQLLSDQKNPSTETFDTLFHSHKEQLMHDMDLLHDKDYFERVGEKRKRGYLFYGHPGCGKTSSVMAMSHYDKRHIIEIPLSRIKKSAEFEELLSLDEIDGIPFKKENVIYLFDEMDREYKENTIKLSTLLSRIDGIGNYNGAIIIATTNHIENIDESLCRDGRLNKLFFDYITKSDFEKLVHLYKKQGIEYPSNPISHATARRMLSTF